MAEQTSIPFIRGLRLLRNVENKVLVPYDCLFGTKIGFKFLIMGDNKSYQSARLIEKFPETENIQHMAWPTYLLDLNPLRHVLDMPCRQFSFLP
ncbi:hypothetical protein NPIL_392961 [Nephila pilipes]|uniref:Uncharacterized protein n=1 Tax=Nephila pilipes TaxID=299642 RepID=A0A8X6N9G7_NEPPI|nr:hypothetical protein NPIL_392961 [Nephila pilipes]